MTDSGRIRVLIADDHAVVREGLKLFLELQDDIEVVGEASDGDEAIKGANELKPDVVLMDLKMPGTDGVAATLDIKQALSDTSVLVLTSFLEDETVRSVLRAGATGYLMKDAAPAEVAEAIRTVHRGQPLLHPGVLSRVVSEFASGKPTRTSNGPTGTVTIAFTDIENSSDLIRELGDDGARSLFREHDQVVRTVLAPHSAREVQHLGDGFMLAFVSKAEGGQILVSDLTRQLVGTTCASYDKGEFALKGLPGLHRLYEVSWEG